MKMSLVLLAVTLLIVGGAFIQETQAQDPFCYDVIRKWSSLGCVYDSKKLCIPYNNANCGWGIRSVIFYCGSNDFQTCKYFCYKPCADEIVQVCKDIDRTDCVIEYATPCSAKCGVGNMTIGWLCKSNEGSGIHTCIDYCCCEKCTGQSGQGELGSSIAGTATPKRLCNEVNMAIPNSAPEKYCPLRGYSTTGPALLW